jgi:hypothetical protein
LSHSLYIEAILNNLSLKGWAHIADFGNRFWHQWTNDSGKKNLLNEKFIVQDFQNTESWTQIVNWSLLIVA